MQLLRSYYISLSHDQLDRKCGTCGIAGAAALVAEHPHWDWMETWKPAALESSFLSPSSSLWLEKYS